MNLKAKDCEVIKHKNEEIRLYMGTWYLHAHAQMQFVQHNSVSPRPVSIVI